MPGNERAVSRLISNLFRRGCDVVHPGTARVHVSGHGSQADLLELLRLTRPEYLVPIHGEYRMLEQHARLAARSGLIAADRVLVADDGDVLAFSARGARKAERVTAGRVLLDRSGASGLDDVVVRDRRQLGSDGVVVPVVVLDKQSGLASQPPEIVTRGFASENERAELLHEAGRVVMESVELLDAAQRGDTALARERVSDELRRFFKRRTQLRPMVIPVVMEV